MGIIGSIPPSYDATNEVVCLPLTSHSAPSPAAGRDTRSRRRRICARLRFGNEGGQSLVEFALCLPPLFLLLTGLTAIGIAFINYNQLSNAADSAAVQLSLNRGALASPYDPCAMVVTQVEAAAPSLKPASMNFSLVINGTPYPATGTSNSGFSCSSTSQSTGAAGVLSLAWTHPVTVTVTYPCELAIKLYGTNALLNCTLTASMTEVVQ